MRLRVSRLVIAAALPVLSALGGAACGDDDEPSVDAGLSFDAFRAEAGAADSSSGPDVALGPFVPTHSLTILHTNDLHSHLMGHGPEADYTPATTRDDGTVGGFARLASALAAQRMEALTTKREVLTLDAGDFMMGTLFEILATQDASELRLMRALGFDATTVGNHELDWTPDGLAAILAAAVAGRSDLPVLATNMRFSATSAADDNLERLKDPGPLKTKLVKTLPTGLKVGFIGLLGKGAASVTPTAAPLRFEEVATASRAAVQDLRENDKVDLVIALSHSGIGSDGTGEDRTLAETVDGLDVIVSGHTHATLTQPVVVTRSNGGKTVIVTAGAYGAFLGRLDLDVRKGPSGVAISVGGYKLIEIDDEIAGSGVTQEAIDPFILAIDALPELASAGLSYRKVVAQTGFDVRNAAFDESPLGNLVTDAYRAVTAAVSGDEPPVVAVEANGTLRDPILRGSSGSIWLADLFRVLPLGIGPDKRPGYPLVAFYLSGGDLRAGMELMAAASSRLIANDDYLLQVSGLEVEYQPTNVLFGRVTSLKLAGGAAVTPEGCYKVVTSYYVASLLGLVSQVTGGAFSVTAKLKGCEAPLPDLAAALVDADLATPGVQELKSYEALLRFVSRLPDQNSNQMPDLPAAYEKPQSRLKKVP